ncbi:hypothetical protein JHD48_01280 [Sulfurimonas sp. SAG-AH-194-I05]|nr:hypothetical protein [Sulfurimonas sp. SAG-AH-194-I05]MDF1874361.1 hypothetical protein [Sulfurimonas sp. SAG-AH-194-I05]
MKYILTILLLSLSVFASTSHEAKILEILESGGYTYMKVQDKKVKYWIAMTQRKVKVGETISFIEQGWMSKFQSKTLNRTFEKILFASDKVQGRQSLKDIKPNIAFSKYKENNTVIIAELFANRDKYVGKEIIIKGKVTKTSIGIIKRNWVHINDGSRFQNMDDIVFTTSGNVPSVGDIVYAKGTVAKDVDFGYGYFYPIIIQKSSFK